MKISTKFLLTVAAAGLSLPLIAAACGSEATIGEGEGEGEEGEGEEGEGEEGEGEGEGNPGACDDSSFDNVDGDGTIELAEPEITRLTDTDADCDGGNRSFDFSFLATGDYDFETDANGSFVGTSGDKILWATDTINDNPAQNFCFTFPLALSNDDFSAGCTAPEECFVSCELCLPAATARIDIQMNNDAGDVSNALCGAPVDE